MARWLNARGYAVHAYDHRGHGESEGPRNHAPSFDTLLDDLERLLGLVRRAHPSGTPLILLGHSMGGLIVSGLLALREPPLAAAVLSGPALRAGMSVGRLRRLAAAGLARIFPRLRFDAGFEPEWLSRDPAVVQAYVADPLISTALSVRLATELLRAAERVRAQAERIRTPLLIVHGEDDRVCSIEGSRELYAALGPALCELRGYPGLRHEVLNEPEAERVLEDIHAWIEKRVGTEPAQ